MTERQSPSAAQRWPISYVEEAPRVVDYVEVDDVPAAIPDAWQRLEAAVGDLRGRRFVGAFDPGTGRYRACVEVSPDPPLQAELSRGELPGGRYARIRLRTEPPELYELIPVAFERLVEQCSIDPERPSLEVYRRRDEVDAMVPVSQ